MAKRSVTFDVKVNTPSAQQEAKRVANIFSSAMKNVPVGTKAGGGGGGGSSSGGGGAGGGGGGGAKGGMPGSSISNLLFGSAQYALAGKFYQFFSNLPDTISEMDKMATANRRASDAFATLTGSGAQANRMIDAYVRGSGNVATRTEATTEAMRLFNLGLATNETQMQKFVTTSRGMAQATGRDVGYIQEQFSLAMSNQSLLRFDQLGLSIQRHKVIMADLQRQYPEMTREVAFQNAMLQQAEERYLGLAAAQGALATSTELMTTKAKNWYDILANIVSLGVMQPIAARLGQAMGVTDINRDVSIIDVRRRANQENAANARTNKQPGLQDLGGGMTTWAGVGSLFGGNQDQSGVNAKLAKESGEQAALGSSIINTMNDAAAAQIKGVSISAQTIQKINEISFAYQAGNATYDQYARTLNMIRGEIAMNVESHDILSASLTDLQKVAIDTSAQIEDLAGTLLGSVVGMVGKLVDAGADAATIESLLPSQEEIELRSKEMVKAGELAGDAISDEIATKLATKELNKPAEDFVQNSKDAASGMKKAATAAESAAKKWEETVNSTADKLKSAFSSMLHSVPGLYSPSEVTESDLYLAKKGYPINKPDDWFRRLSDVALNKSKRTDVDLGLIARAVGHPGETDPMALMYLAQQGMGDLSVYSNPEIANQLINKDAVKAGLHSQEMSALGNQTLEAMFGIGTPEQNAYLKVFGVKAVDPIQEGFITEITTKGPQMGGMMADQMHEGFTSQARSIPWVAELMAIMTQQVGRTIAADQNSNASSDLATSESVPYTTPATSSNGLSYR